MGKRMFVMESESHLEGSSVAFMRTTTPPSFQQPTISVPLPSLGARIPGQASPGTGHHVTQAVKPSASANSPLTLGALAQLPPSSDFCQAR